MSRERALALAAGLSVAGAVFAFLLGVGTALSEESGYWAFWVLTGICATVATLCDRGRRGS